MHFAVFVDLAVNFNQQILLLQGGNMLMKIVIGGRLCHVALQSKVNLADLGWLQDYPLPPQSQAHWQG